MTPAQAAHMALWVALVPTVSAFACSLALWWRREHTPTPARLITLGLLGFASVYIIAHGLLIGWPALPPREAIQFIPVAALIGAVLGCLDLAVPALRSRAASVAIILLVGVLLPRSVTMTGKAAWLPVGLLVWSLLWCGLRVVASSPTRFVPVIVLGLLSACAAATLAGSGNLKQGQLAGVIAFCTLGVCIAQTTRPRVSLAGPAAGAAAAVIAATLAQGVAYGSTPYGAAMLIAAAAVAAIPATTAGTVKPSSWKRVALAGAVVLALGSAAIVYAGLSGGSTGYDDYASSP
jgi:hypothetical protein